MSQRRRLPNSLRWRAVGWMEMGLSQADAARRLNVSRSVVQRLWDQYQSEDSVSRRPVPGRPRATTPAEDRFLALSARRRRTTTVPQLVADHFQASGRRISATTVRNRLHNAGLYARRPVVCVPPQWTTAKEPLMLGKRTCFLDAATMGFCAVPDLQWRVIQGVY
ncbi:HTH_Tnp_Tc3_2 domain-containing protein [Trichonephila clavipes]|uniref:HTH_Tnp_Tc3_2 domain-containing protein n=1 Tax=Trichonephila clavipes TaxID=2585209 RepID=A0A8X6VJI3_TRICX|nr:HTH_Tnp_Tc3_2 domain-containing protein [Trichonephila clavipes]